MSQPPQAVPRVAKASVGRGRRLASALIATALLVALGATAALGAPGTIRIIETSPSLGHEVTVALPGGGSFSDDPGRPLARVTPSGGSALETAAWCVDWQRDIDEGIDYPVDLESAADAPELAGPGALEAAWLMGRADRLIAASATPGLEAAAIQVAVWQLTGQAADVTAVTDDAALNARAAELRALARGRSPARSVALAGPAGAVAPGQPAAVVVSGTPGAEVSLELIAGAALLSATSVMLGPDGVAHATVTPSGPGEVVLAARAEGGLLWRAAHVEGSAAPQDMAYVAPSLLSAQATLHVGVGPAPRAVVPLAKRPAVLRLGKRAPKAALRGRPIPYELTVTNVSGRIARDVVVRDRVPDGTDLTRKPARARLSGDELVWRLGDIAPHDSVTVRLRLRPKGPVAAVRNVARASAANAATVRAEAVTRLRSRPRRVAPVVVPPVTG